jgi:hypothetical protein
MTRPAAANSRCKLTLHSRRLNLTTTYTRGSTHSSNFTTVGRKVDRNETPNHSDSNPLPFSQARSSTPLPTAPEHLPLARHSTSALQLPRHSPPAN